MTRSISTRTGLEGIEPTDRAQDARWMSPGGRPVRPFVLADPSSAGPNSAMKAFGPIMPRPAFVPADDRHELHKAHDTAQVALGPNALRLGVDIVAGFFQE